jgi:hypothetical protein
MAQKIQGASTGLRVRMDQVLRKICRRLIGGAINLL